MGGLAGSATHAMAAPSSGSSSTAAPSTGAPEVSDQTGLASALQRDLGMTVDQFKQQGVLAQQATELSAALANDSGFRYVVIRSGKLVVIGTGSTVASVAAQYGASVDSSAVDPDIHSVKQLLDLYTEQVGSQDGLQSIVMTDQGYVIKAKNPDSPRAAAATPGQGSAAAAKKSPTDFAKQFKKVKVVSSDKPAQGAAATDLYNGEGYGVGTNESVICSTGFAGFDGSGNALTISAGHCATSAAAGAPIYPINPSQEPGFTGKSGTYGSEYSTTMGSYSWYDFGPNSSPTSTAQRGTDFSIISGGSSANTQWPAVMQWQNSGTSDPTSNPIHVTGTVAATVGQAVCRSGRTTGWHCAKIDETGEIDVWADSAGTKQALVWSAVSYGIAADHGDSGGSWISGQKAVGVTSAVGCDNNPCKPPSGMAYEWGTAALLVGPQEGSVNPASTLAQVRSDVSVKLWLNSPQVNGASQTGSTGTMTLWKNGQVISGKVPADSGDTLPSGTKVQVSANGWTTTVATDASGNYSFTYGGGDMQPGQQATLTAINGYSKSMYPTAIVAMASVTLNQPASPIPGGQSVTYTGKANPAVGGSTVILDGILPDGTYAGGFASGTTKSDGTFSITSSWSTGVQGVIQVRAVLQAGGNFARGDYLSYTRANSISISSVTGGFGQTATINGSVSPARGGDQVILDVTLPDGSYQGGVATTTTRSDGTFTVQTDAGRFLPGTTTFQVANNNGWWARSQSQLTRTEKYSLSLNGIPSTGITAPITLSGSMTPSMAGWTVIFDGIADGNYSGGIATATIQADGTYSTTTNWSAGAVCHVCQVRAAVQAPSGSWQRSNYQQFSRDNVVTITSPTAGSTVPFGQAVTIRGTVSPARAGVTVLLDGYTTSGAYNGGIGSAVSAADGTWSTTISWDQWASGTDQVRAAVNDGFWARTDYIKFNRPAASYTWTMNSVPSTIAGDAALTLSGKITPAVPGATVIIDGSINGAYVSQLATATVNADGTWSTTTTWGAGQQATFTVRAAIHTPTDTWLRTADQTFKRDNVVTITSTSNKVLSGTVGPARGGATVLIDIQNVGGSNYVGSVARVTTNADGTWSVPMTWRTGTFQVRAAVDAGWWARTDYVTVTV